MNERKEDVQPSTRTLDYEPDVANVAAPLRDLGALSWQELLAARRQGRDPDELVSEFWDRYDEAFAEAARRAAAAADQLGVPPIEMNRRLIDAAGEACGRVPERVTRWGVAIPRFNMGRPPATRPRPGRVVVRKCFRSKRRSRAAGTTSPSRGDPDDADPHLEPDHGLSGRTAELAAELQAHSDARVAAWRAEWAKPPEQLELEEGS